MSTSVWVIGAGGMLGSAVARRFRAGARVQLFEAGPIRWGTDFAIADLVSGFERLLKMARSEWQVVWCAGAAVTASNEAALDAEVRVFRAFLSAIATHPHAIVSRGSVFLASSAGGVYGGSVDPPFDEQTPPAPLGAYGMAKLAAEQSLRDFSSANGVPVAIGRIANLYGRGQKLGKQQGLISQLCVADLLGRPISIYVSLDTRRDYIYVDDCAALIVATCFRLRTENEPPDVHCKIIGSGRSVTIASVIGEFRQVSRARRVRIVTVASPHSSFQGRDLRLISRYWTDLDQKPKTPLIVGMANTLADLSFALNREGIGSVV